MEEDKKPKVHFGNPGPSEKKPRLKMGSFGSASSAAIMEGIQAGNINISDGIVILCFYPLSSRCYIGWRVPYALYCKMATIHGHHNYRISDASQS